MSQTFSRRVALLAVVLVAGCSSKRAPTGADVPPATPEQARTFATASNALSADLYGVLGKAPGNLVYSPLSVSTALTMTWLGARGETRDQMTRVLHLDDVKGADASMLTAAAPRVLAALTDPMRADPMIHVANRLFGERSYGFDTGFLDATRKQYGAELATVDFIGAPEPARKEINDYVETATHGKIADLIPSDGIGPLVRIVLVNAIYLRARWEYPFAERSTQKMPFHPTPSSTVDVDTMFGELKAAGGEVDGVQIVELPYKSKDEDLVMTILLPKDASRLPDLEAKIAAGGFDAMVQNLARRTTIVMLPKFKIDPSQPLALDETLAALGMPLAFSEAADFSGMSKPGQRPLQLGSVLHKAFIAVDERGTEAAAASVVMGREQSASELFEVLADHPFLFALREKKSGLILFMGRLTDPS